MTLRSESVILEAPGSVRGYTRRIVKVLSWRMPWKLVGIPLFILLLGGVLVILAWTIATWVLAFLPKLLFRRHRRVLRQRKIDLLRHREIMGQ